MKDGKLAGTHYRKDGHSFRRTVYACSPSLAE
jgi:hypothetical protein